MKMNKTLVKFEKSKKPKVSRKEKKFFKGSGRRVEQVVTIEKKKAKPIDEEEKMYQEIMLGRKLKIKEILPVESKSIVVKHEVTTKAEKVKKPKKEKAPRPRKESSSVTLLNERRIERLRTEAEKRETEAKLKAEKEKLLTIAKKANKKERIKTLQKKAEELRKKEELEPKISESKGISRSRMRMIVNGRPDGKKNRRKDRIVVVKASGREFIEEYETKSGQAKKRYYKINNPEVRKVVVLETPIPAPVFNKKKEEDAI